MVKAMAPTLQKEAKELRDESDGSKSDRHCKRPSKKAKALGDDFYGKGLSALKIPKVSTLLVHIFFFSCIIIIIIIILLVDDLFITYFYSHL